MKKPVFGLFLAFISQTASAQYDPKALETLDAMSKRYKEINAFEASISSVMTNEVEKLREEMKA
ncbi:MAG: outer membrane lipoprotein carrier protein LolA, partial [Cyclobacteriaceae bacterium]